VRLMSREILRSGIEVDFVTYIVWTLDDHAL
jgi:hypothetical protein